MLNYVILTTHFSYIYSMWDFTHTCNPTFFKSCAWLPKIFFWVQLGAYNYSYIIGNHCVVLQIFSNFLQIYENESSKFRYTIMRIFFSLSINGWEVVNTFLLCLNLQGFFIFIMLEQRKKNFMSLTCKTYYLVSANKCLTMTSNWCN